MLSEQNVESDIAIVARVVDGDSDAYALLMERYEKKLLRYTTYLIHDEAMAADAVQETFIKAYQNLRSYKPQYSYSAWIYRIAHNEALNIVKRERHTIAQDESTMNESFSYDPRLSERIDSSLAQRHIHECLIDLDMKYREVLQLIYFEHMKYEEVSDVLRVPRNTVGVWVQRAKRQLRAICERKGVRHV